CGTSREEIVSGLATVLSPEMQLMAKTVVNPYEKPDTLDLMVKAIAETPLEGILVKPFYDINQ
ncbi:MAG: UDP-N-acetylglucosamine 2-epimerase (hydrolyzing), partial [Bacteroidales bacterium]|nr:UDP-N-acetylglucosamine 2-epimerase (hydrolyzing) [Bacteroidales bacterium]